MEQDRHKPQRLGNLLTSHNSVTQAGITPMSPIFSPDKAEIVFYRLKQYYIDEVFQRTGQHPKDMAFFEPKLKGLTNWICNTSSTKRGLIIGGSVGIGKTTIAAAIRTLLNNSGYLGYTMQMSAKYVGDYYRYREEGDKWNIYTGETKVKRFEGPAQPICKVLFVDDLGMEEDEFRDYGTKTQPMAKLIHDRHERGLVTIFSTNLGSMEMLREKYDDRIMDRMNSYCKLFYTMRSFRG